MSLRYLSVCAGIEAASVKRCAKCNETKTLDDFHRQRTGPQGRHSWCKSCANVYYRANKKRNYSSPQRRRWQIKTRYGLTVEAVDALKQKQNGRCGLCLKDLSAGFHIDHNHTTGQVRGLLCHRCNVRIGGLEDAEYRARAWAWLERG